METCQQSIVYKYSELYYYNSQMKNGKNLIVQNW